jgi:phosphoribosylformimino-5-aminoimidazole carboxamide ribotide isomerase
VVCRHGQMADYHGDGDNARFAPCVPYLLHYVLIDAQESISMLEPYCSEFLIHAADNEGLQEGIDEELVSRLGEWCSVPVTYAGGGRNLGDLDLIKARSGGKVDLTIGSALDIFGGTGVTFEDCVAWNMSNS